MTQTSLAERLRVLRAQKGLTLTEASKQLGIDRHTLRRLELGTGRKPFYPTLNKIAEGYGVPVEELLEQPMPPLGEAPSTPGRDEGARREIEDLLARASSEIERAERGELPWGGLDPLRDDLQQLAMMALERGGAGMIGDYDAIKLAQRSVDLQGRILVAVMREAEEARREADELRRALAAGEGSISSGEAFGTPTVERKVEELAPRVRRGEISVEEALRQAAIGAA